ncbi:hypothetical protein [Mesobacillus jeotgali]|uniref:hypothetical protein n=1 Tax=Mesobacillus jeotgali TaxID=129985 RepID=UPI0009A79E6E|nr:hypothetical protein [Mesobacillus jeotgali]
MKRQEFILSSEELSFALALCQFDGIASSILKESVGDVTEEGIELIFQTASRSLFTKGILLSLDEENPNKAFINGFSELLEGLATSNNMFRAYNENENGKFVLTAHRSRNGLIFHIVSNQIIHVLSEVSQEELIEEITAFFQPQFKTWDSIQFSVNEKDFEEFMQSVKLKTLIIVDSNANQFLNDFHENKGNLVNFSLIRTEDDGITHFLEVVMLLSGKDRIWALKEEADGSEININIKTLDKMKWQQLLESVLSQLTTSKIS